MEDLNDSTQGLDTATAAANFFGRKDSTELLSNFLLGEHKEGEHKRLKIIGISGLGGVGKSHLLEHVLRTTDLNSRRYLTLKLQGSKKLRTLAELMTKDILRSCPQEIETKFFQNTKKCRKAIEAMDLAVQKAFEDHISQNEKDNHGLRESLNILTQLGIGVLELSGNKNFASYVRSFVDKNSTAINKIVEDLQNNVPAYYEKSGLAAFFESSLKTRLRSSRIGEVLAEEFVKDLTNIFNSEEAGKNSEHMRLLFIIDDYESLAEVMGEFLFSKLIPELEQQTFETAMVFLCRDRIADVPVHQQWDDKIKSKLVGEIALKAFSAKEAKEYIEARGVKEQSDVERILEDTEGLPYLLDSEVSAQLDGGRSALGWERFYQRSTRWMTPKQQRWLEYLCFLDIVNIKTIKALFSEETSAAIAILDWFKKDSSSRSPSDNHWTVRKLIKRCIRAKMQNDNPDRYDELQQKAALINTPSPPSS